MKCSLCHSDETIKFLDLGRQPLANKYPTKAQIEHEDFFPLQVYFCNRCRNVELGTKVSRERMFEDYYYLSSVNQALVRHFEQLAKKVSKARFIVDIGSNDGILLKPLKALGIKALGVEPSVNVSKIANDAQLATLTAFFDSETVRKIEREYGKPDVIVASSVFTHLEDPHQLIEDVKALLTDDGEFIIEVEYIGNILKNIQFERFYLDRIFYYSLASLSHLFEQHDMLIVDVEDIEPHGGSIRVTTRKKDHASLPTGSVALYLEQEKNTLTLHTLKKFAEEVDMQLSALKRKLVEYQASNLKVAGYGAPARVSTICNYGKIGPDLIEFIVDDSPLKQNKFSPGTHIPIVPNEYLKEHKPDVFVVFAYEYFDDIKKKTPGSHRYLLPIPPREVV